jgi:hypothetical protein
LQPLHIDSLWLPSKPPWKATCTCTCNLNLQPAAAAYWQFVAAKQAALESNLHLHLQPEPATCSRCILAVCGCQASRLGKQPAPAPAT